VEVTLVELKDIQLPDSMKRAMARQAEAEREKRAKIIHAEGEAVAAAALGEASDTMMAHPLALQPRNLQSLVEIGVDKNTTVVFPAPLMSTIEELGALPRPREDRRQPRAGTAKHLTCPRVGTRRGHPGRIGAGGCGCGRARPGRRRGKKRGSRARPGPGFCRQSKQRSHGLVTLHRMGDQALTDKSSPASLDHAVTGR
jgi:hypothetical protein